MPNSNTTGKGAFIKQVTGENLDNWGDYVNQNFDALDTMFSGSKSVALTNVNMTVSASDAKNFLFNFNGAITANVRIDFPTAQGFYAFINSTTGNFSVKVAVTGYASNGIIVPRGRLMFAFCDGTTMQHVSGHSNVSIVGASDGNYKSVSLTSNGSGELTVTTAGGSTYFFGDASSSFSAPISVSYSGVSGIAGAFRASTAGHSAVLGNSQDGNSYAYLGYQNSNGLYCYSSASHSVRSVATVGCGVYASSTDNYALFGITSHASYGGVIGYSNSSVFGICGFGSYSFYGNSNAYVSGVWQTSDARFKENISPIEDAISIISKIEFVSYEWKEGTAQNAAGYKRDVGVIAQQAMSILPDMVREVVPPSPPAPASDESVPAAAESFLTAEYRVLIPYLGRAVQQLTERLSAAESRIAEMEKMK